MARLPTVIPVSDLRQDAAGVLRRLVASDEPCHFLESLIPVDGDVVEIHHTGGAVRTELQEELDPLSSVGIELTEHGLLSVPVEQSDRVGCIVGIESADESTYFLAIHVVEYVSLDRLR